MERRFKPEEIKILDSGRSPRPGEPDQDESFLGCLLFIFVITYGALGMALNQYLNIFWSMVLPWPILGLVYVLFRSGDQMKTSRQFGNALVETVTATGIQLNKTKDGHTIQVMYDGGEITWTGKITIMYVGDTEAQFRSMLQRYGISAGQPDAGYDVPLDALLVMREVLVRFVPNGQTAAYHLPCWSLADYFRTEYNLIRSSKTGMLLFINLVSGTKDYFNNNVSFTAGDIAYDAISRE